MMSLWQAPIVVAALVAWLAAPPQSMADLARREAIRRQVAAKSTLSLTNDGLPAAPPSAVSVAGGGDLAETSVPAEPESASESAVPAVPDSQPQPSPSSGTVGDEKWWREQFAKARATLQQDQAKAEAAQSRVNALQTDLSGRDDPAQRTVVKNELDRVWAELQRLKAAIVTDQQAIETLQSDARRRGALPGWTR